VPKKVVVNAAVPITMKIAVVSLTHRSGRTVALCTALLLFIYVTDAFTTFPCPWAGAPLLLHQPSSITALQCDLHDLFMKLPQAKARKVLHGEVERNITRALEGMQNESALLLQIYLADAFTIFPSSLTGPPPTIGLPSSAAALPRDLHEGCTSLSQAQGEIRIRREEERRATQALEDLQNELARSRATHKQLVATHAKKVRSRDQMLKQAEVWDKRATRVYGKKNMRLCNHAWSHSHRLQDEAKDTNRWIRRHQADTIDPVCQRIEVLVSEIPVAKNNQGEARALLAKSAQDFEDLLSESRMRLVGHAWDRIPVLEREIALAMDNQREACARLAKSTQEVHDLMSRPKWRTIWEATLQVLTNVLSRWRGKPSLDEALRRMEEKVLDLEASAEVSVEVAKLSELYSSAEMVGSTSDLELQFRSLEEAALETGDFDDGLESS
jgi:hypothetical protein